VNIIMSYTSLEDVRRNPEMLVKLPPQEIAETRIAAHAVMSACDAAATRAPEPVAAEPDRPLGADEAVELYPDVVERRWLFRNAGKLPFIKKLSKKRLSISKRGLERHLGITKS
jgi:hypothetical protein